MFYPVSSTSEDTVKDNISGTWYQNYKWKPPEENTIDFKLSFVKEEVNGRKVNKITSFQNKGRTQKCQQVQLYASYNIYNDNTDIFSSIFIYEVRFTRGAVRCVGYNLSTCNFLIFELESHATRRGATLLNYMWRGAHCHTST